MVGGWPLREWTGEAPELTREVPPPFSGFLRRTGEGGLAKEVAGGIPKEGRKIKENYTGFKSGCEDERLESLAWLWVTKSPCPAGWEERASLLTIIQRGDVLTSCKE